MATMNPSATVSFPRLRRTANRFADGLLMVAEAVTPEVAEVDAGPLVDSHVMIVEDEALLALDLEYGLFDADAHVVGPFCSIDGALRGYAQAERVDAAILDVHLGEDVVYELARRLQLDGVPFVFHTADGCPQRLRERFGHVPVCVKPTAPRHVLAQVEDLLRSH